MSSTMPFFSPLPDPILKALPKCNIHTHLEGSVRPSTFRELAKLHGLEVELASRTIADSMQVTGAERNLVDYLQKIEFGYQVFLGGQEVQRIAYEAAEDAALDGVVYLELRAGPVTHSRPGFAVEDVIASILQGLHQAQEKYGIECRFIVSALRHHDPEINVRLAHVALECQNDGVVGFDLAGDEAGYPAQIHAKAFQVARDGGLGITIHAGEAAGAEHVRYAVEELGATRIGHGVRSTESDAVLAMLRKRSVLLEICPTSNVHTNTVNGIQKHPIRKLYDRGILISVGDDDPITSRTTVSKELTLLHNNFNFTIEEIKNMQQMGITAAFINDSKLKRKMLQLV